MIFKATVMQLANLSGNFKMNCMSCLSNELSPLTPSVRLWKRSRVWGVTFSGIRVGLFGSRANLACVKV